MKFSFFFFFLLLFSLSYSVLALEGFGYNDPTLPKLNANALRWLNTDGSNFFTDSLIDYDNSLFNFSIDKTALDGTINDLGYNHTDNLTGFYDLRYLTGQLSLYFSNQTDPINSAYTVMNTTIPISGTETTSHNGLSNGDNLITKRIFSELNLSQLESGAYDQHTTIDYTAGTKDVSMRSEIYILYANGTETMIGSSPPSIGLIVGVYQQVQWTGTIIRDVQFNVSGGDYLTMYLYATISGVGSSPDIDLIVGEGTGARLDIGINPTDIRVNEVDPFAIFKDGSTPLTGLWNYGSFGMNGSGAINTTGNIEADTYFGNWSGGNINGNVHSAGNFFNLTQSTSPSYQVTDTTNAVTTVMQSLDTLGLFGTTTNHPLALATNSMARLSIGTTGNFDFLTNNLTNIDRIDTVKGNFTSVNSTIFRLPSGACIRSNATYKFMIEPTCLI